MSYYPRFAEHLTALNIADAALETSTRARRLRRCRELLSHLDPDKPPSPSQAREFNWQYRAFRERVYLYSARLEAVRNADHVTDEAIRKTDWAIELSLRYFRNVLKTPLQRDSEDENTDGNS